MFTGIVESTGTVAALELSAAGGHLVLAEAPFAAELEIGESVAVNGCCLTVTRVDEAGNVHFDLLQETLRLTNLGLCPAGSPVNLERAMRADSRLSGHFVQGHVDTTGEILVYEKEGQDHRFTVSLPESGKLFVIPKGSITVDGMSLTIAELEADRFTIWITPHTHAVTTLRHARAGLRVNLEFDMMAKYVERHLAARAAAV